MQLVEGCKGVVLKIIIDKLNEGDNEVYFEKSEVELALKNECQDFSCSEFIYSITKRGEYLYIKGGGHIDLKLNCDRCTEEFNDKFEVIHEVVFKKGSLSQKDEDDSVELLSDTERFLDFSPYLIEEVLLNIPYIKLCSDECKGVCYICGQNLNSGVCECSKEQKIDPRWEKLAEISKNMNFK
ncbi:MAG: DUF177 domain-containing protein [Candidatus Delongbacteria bacterium]|nr:DUF177 domain-containing protein [Candidatus Delongbacteria bacterium]MBN2837021.1 DUF177 domain-containing protein [Candidatus Delongbacteria bacterium]